MLKLIFLVTTWLFKPKHCMHVWNRLRTTFSVMYLLCRYILIDIFKVFHWNSKIKLGKGVGKRRRFKYSADRMPFESDFARLNTSLARSSKLKKYFITSTLKKIREMFKRYSHQSMLFISSERIYTFKNWL